MDIMAIIITNINRINSNNVYSVSCRAFIYIHYVYAFSKKKGSASSFICHVFIFLFKFERVATL